jgi:hypothetical protein
MVEEVAQAESVIFVDCATDNIFVRHVTHGVTSEIKAD